MTEKEIKRLEFARSSIHESGLTLVHSSAKIADSSKINSDGFGYARDENGLLVKVNHAGGIQIDKGVEIREFCTVDRATVKGQFTQIGEFTVIDHHVHVAHNVKIGKHNTIANGCSIEGSCQIGDFNTFGSMVVMQRKTKIGNNCTVGSGAVVTKDFGDNCIIVGNPGRVLRMKK